PTYNRRQYTSCQHIPLPINCIHKFRANKIIFTKCPFFVEKIRRTCEQFKPILKQRLDRSFIQMNVTIKNYKFDKFTKTANFIDSLKNIFLDCKLIRIFSEQGIPKSVFN